MAADLHIHVVPADKLGKHNNPTLEDIAIHQLNPSWMSTASGESYYVKRLIHFEGRDWAGPFHSGIQMPDDVRLRWDSLPSKERRESYFDLIFYDDEYNRRAVGRTESLWIGEVSWLKQTLFGQSEGEYVPSLVQEISDVFIDEFGKTWWLVDDQLIKEVKQAIEKAGSNNHEFYRVVEDTQEIIDFLEQHRGCIAYYLVW